MLNADSIRNFKHASEHYLASRHNSVGMAAAAGSIIADSHLAFALSSPALAVSSYLTGLALTNAFKPWTPPSPPPQPPLIFISYRRLDTAWQTVRIRANLERRLKGVLVTFLDTDILPGQKYPAWLRSQLEVADYMLVVIGDNWANLENKYGPTSVKDDDDWVRLEVATALKDGTPIVPIVVANSSDVFPVADLPPDIEEINEYEVLRLRPLNFEDDLDRLVDALLALNAAQDDDDHGDGDHDDDDEDEDEDGDRSSRS